MRLIGYALEATKGKTILPGFSAYKGDYEWGYSDHAMVFRTVREAQMERRQIPKDNWPEGADALTIFPVYT